MLVEALLAIAIISAVIPIVVALISSGQSLQLLANNKLASFGDIRSFMYGGIESHVAISNVDYSYQLGRNECRIGKEIGTFTPASQSLSVLNKNTFIVHNIVNSGTITNVVARNGFAYETLDSTIPADPDFAIINVENPQSPFIVASINTGPGLASVAVAGHYAYVANESSASQLQIIDIANRILPVVVAKLKLPYAISTTTRPHAVSIYYQNGLIYLGTEKWLGNELNIIDVHNPLQPKYIGGLDTNTVINAIVIVDKAYLTGADAYQLRVADVSNASNPQLLGGFSPAGFEVLEGKAVDISASSTLYFARVGGGFDNSSQYELFSFNLVSDPLISHPLNSINIVGGVYGVVAVPKYVFIAVGNGIVTSSGGRSTGGSIGILQSDTFSILGRINLPAAPLSLMCDEYRLYAALANGQGFAVITFNNNDTH